ncbi:MAG: ribosome-associated translation inhibitor RaiA [Patescibacteria group bacterium]
MKILIKATNFELTPALREFVEEKIGQLAKLLSRWDHEGGIEIQVEVGKTTHHHNKGDVFRAEANLHLPNAMLRAEDTNETIYSAIDKVRDKLKRELERYKEKNS